jgi:hypothetical protein
MNIAHPVNSEEINTAIFPFTLKNLSSNILSLIKHQLIHRHLHLALCFQLGERREKVKAPDCSHRFKIITNMQDKNFLARKQIHMLMRKTNKQEKRLIPPAPGHV